MRFGSAAGSPMRKPSVSRTRNATPYAGGEGRPRPARARLGGDHARGSASRTEEVVGLQGKATERFAEADEAPTGSPQIRGLVYW